MKKIFVIVALAAVSCQTFSAKSINDVGKIASLEDKCAVLQHKLSVTDSKLLKLTQKQKASERKIQQLDRANNTQRQAIDSLQSVCKSLESAQSADRKSINGKIDATDSNVQANQEMLQTRTLWGIVLVVALLAVVAGIAYWLTKRIKSGATSIGEVRKAQDALQAAQTKMQEESVKLDDKLLELFDRQMASTPKVVGNDKPDHSLALKVADEIVRIELNMSRMDSSIKGYKQLAKAVQRIKDNFKANGYEIVDMLGMPYNEGMKVTANFVSDEDLEEGKQIITGITKPQINYNGQMIQAAQITVSQNI